MKLLRNAIFPECFRRKVSVEITLKCGRCRYTFTRSSSFEQITLIDSVTTCFELEKRVATYVCIITDDISNRRFPRIPCPECGVMQEYMCKSRTLSKWLLSRISRKKRKREGHHLEVHCPKVLVKTGEGRVIYHANILLESGSEVITVGCIMNAFRIRGGVR